MPSIKKPRRDKSTPVAVLRFDDWPSRLSSFIESRRSEPFKWGTNDCCIFACDAINVMTGYDPAAEKFRGKYTTQLGAAKLIKRYGSVEGIAEAICEQISYPEILVSQARRGDVVSCVLTEGEVPALGICLGAQSVFVSEHAGISFVPTLKACRRAWRT